MRNLNEDGEGDDVEELAPPEYLRDLAERLKRSPGTDQYDVDRLRSIAAGMVP